MDFKEDKFNLLDDGAGHWSRSEFNRENNEWDDKVAQIFCVILVALIGSYFIALTVPIFLPPFLFIPLCIFLGYKVFQNIPMENKYRLLFVLINPLSVPLYYGVSAIIYVLIGRPTLFKHSMIDRIDFNSLTGFYERSFDTDGDFKQLDPYWLDINNWITKVIFGVGVVKFVWFTVICIAILLLLVSFTKHS